MSVDLTTCGSVAFDRGLPGQWADQTPNYVDSFYNEASSGGLAGDGSVGTIDFGVAAAAGTTDHGCKPVGSNGDKIVGITTRLPLMPTTPSVNTIGWKSHSMVGIAGLGHILAIPCENVRKNDEVLAIVAQGGKLAGTNGGVAGTGRLVVTGARWLDTTTAGQIGVIEIIGREAVVTTC